MHTLGKNDGDDYTLWGWRGEGIGGRVVGIAVSKRSRLALSRPRDIKYTLATVLNVHYIANFQSVCNNSTYK
jgi:hypothetical protein